MKCPYCRTTDTEVFNSRSTRFETQIWRRRRCLACAQSFTTYEAPDLSFLRILRGAKAEHYNRARLFSSIYLAFLDIPSKDDTIDAVTSTIEAKLLDLQQVEIAPIEISRLVLTTLKHFNTAAFVRYLTTHTTMTSNAELNRELKKY